MTWTDRVAERYRELMRRRATHAFSGVCAECRHDWREHLPDQGCSECRYEIDHGEPDAPSTVCAAQAPGHTFP